MLTRQRAHPAVLVAILGTSWGLRSSLLKLAALSGLNHATVIAATTTGVAVLLVCVNLVRQKLAALRRRRLPFFFTCAVLGYVLPWFLLLFAAERVPATTLTLILGMIPIATACFGIVLRADHLSVNRLGSLVIGTIAVVVLVAPEARISNTGAIAGVGAVLGATCVYGIYFNYAYTRWPSGLDSLQMACGEVVVAAVIMIPVYLLSGAQVPEFTKSTGGGWIITSLIALFMLDTYVYFESLRLSGPIVTAAGNYVMIVAGLAWGGLLLGERFPGRLWVSLALVFVALVLLRSGPRNHGGDRATT